MHFNSLYTSMYSIFIDFIIVFTCEGTWVLTDVVKVSPKDRLIERKGSSSSWHVYHRETS